MLITLNPGEQRQITWAASAAHTPPVGQYLIANTDETVNVFIGPADAGRQVPDLTADIARSQLVALQAIQVNANLDWYAYNPATAVELSDTFIDTFIDTFGGMSAGGGTVTLDVIPDSGYWAPSPAQTAIQIAALGLMTEVTGQAINTSTGTTATNTGMTVTNTGTTASNTGTTASNTGTTASNTGTTASNTGTALTAGVPPGVPNIATKVRLFGTPGGSPYTLFTFPAKGRVWVASVSGTATPNAGYGAGPTVNVYAQLVTGSGITLAVIDMVIAATGIIDSKQSDVQWNGFSVSAGDTLTLDVNNGVTPSMTVIRASGFVAYSVP
jgi:hypothetical protein